jgi:hypothetical protein
MRYGNEHPRFSGTYYTSPVARLQNSSGNGAPQKYSLHLAAQVARRCMIAVVERIWD